MSDDDVKPKRPKVGGRKKGTPNKVTSEFRALMNLCGFMLPNEMVELYRNTNNEFIKFKLLELMASYSYPKPKMEEPDTNKEPVDVDNVMKKLEQVSNEVLIEIAQREKKV